MSNVTFRLPGQYSPAEEHAEDLASTSLSLARRFSAGATMWCASPAWPHHALHLSVEFVYPVIVGKRALPAHMVPAETLVSTLRTSARSGDIFAAIGRGDDPVIADAMQRCQAWGLETVWLGAGPLPDAGLAAHVLWLPSCDPLEVSEQLILSYHLLWELTHVCFEHPGVLKDNTAVCTGEVCVTCSDEGRLVEVEAMVDDTTARVRTPRGVEQIDICLVGDVEPGDLVVVHAGSAIQKLEPYA